MRATATWIGFVLGAGALVLQFAVTVSLRLAAGDGIFGAAIYYASFFTILTNLALVLVYASELWPRQWLDWFRAQVTRGMLAAAGALVMGLHPLVLAEIWDPRGLGLLADTALHYVAPVVYLIWWGALTRHGQLKYADIPTMLLPATIYLVYAMIRGAMFGDYPYPVLDADRLGYGLVAINVALVLVALAILCAAAVVIDGLISRFDRPRV